MALMTIIPTYANRYIGANMYLSIGVHDLGELSAIRFTQKQ